MMCFFCLLALPCITFPLWKQDFNWSNHAYTVMERLLSETVPYRLSRCSWRDAGYRICGGGVEDLWGFCRYLSIFSQCCGEFVGILLAFIHILSTIILHIIYPNKISTYTPYHTHSDIWIECGDNIGLIMIQCWENIFVICIKLWENVDFIWLKWWEYVDLWWIECGRNVDYFVDLRNMAPPKLTWLT